MIDQTQNFTPSPRVALILKSIRDDIQSPSQDSDNFVRAKCQSLLNRHGEVTKPIAPLINSINEMIDTKSVADRADDVTKIVAIIAQLLPQ